MTNKYRKEVVLRSVYCLQNVVHNVHLNYVARLYGVLPCSACLFQTLLIGGGGLTETGGFYLRGGLLNLSKKRVSAGLSKVAGCWRKSPLTWSVSAGYSS